MRSAHCTRFTTSTRSGVPRAGSKASGVGHPQLGHPHESLHRHALRRVDVGLGLTARGHGAGDLAGLPRAADRRSLQHPHHIAEHGNGAQAAQPAEPAQPGERIVGLVSSWRIVGHGGMVGPCTTDCPAVGDAVSGYAAARGSVEAGRGDRRSGVGGTTRRGPDRRAGPGSLGPGHRQGRRSGALGFGDDQAGRPRRRRPRRHVLGCRLGCSSGLDGDRGHPEPDRDRTGGSHPAPGAGRSGRGRCGPSGRHVLGDGLWSLEGQPGAFDRGRRGPPQPRLRLGRAAAAARALGRWSGVRAPDGRSPCCGRWR